MILKHRNLKCFFVGNPESPYFTSKIFEGILHFIQTKTNKAKLKQLGRNGILVVQEIPDMKTLYGFLEQMEKGVIPELVT